MAEDESTEIPETIQIPTAWLVSDEPVHFANQFLFQRIGEAEYVLALGQAIPPPILGTAEERAAQIRNISFVSIQPLVRVSLTRERVEELVRVLQSVLEGSEPSSPS